MRLDYSPKCTVGHTSAAGNWADVTPLTLHRRGLRQRRGKEKKLHDFLRCAGKRKRTPSVDFFTTPRYVTHRFSQRVPGIPSVAAGNRVLRLES